MKRNIGALDQVRFIYTSDNKKDNILLAGFDCKYITFIKSNDEIYVTLDDDMKVDSSKNIQPFLSRYDIPNQIFNDFFNHNELAEYIIKKYYYRPILHLCGHNSKRDENRLMPFENCFFTAVSDYDMELLEEYCDDFRKIKSLDIYDKKEIMFYKKLMETYMQENKFIEKER